jgi:uncharacterized RDD family membrane protein YckC
MHYAGFWRRFGAYLIDFVVLMPLIAVSYYWGEKSHLFHAYWFLPGLTIGYLFHVWLVVRYGGTPGKLVLKTRIAMTDGAPVTHKAAMVRYSVLFVFSVLISLATLLGTLNMPPELYYSLGFIERGAQIVEYAPGWYQPVMILMNVWIWSEFIVILCNKKRRALHDFMAGTVVVRTGLQPAAPAAAA